MSTLFPALVVAFVAGLVVGSWLALPPQWVALPVGLLAALGLAARRGRGRLGWGLALLLFSSLGAFHAQRILPSSVPDGHLARWAGGGPVNLEGILVEAPDVRPDRVRLTLEAATLWEAGPPQSVSGLVVITVGEGGDRFRYGDRVRLRCRLRVPPPNGNPGGFDRRKHLALRGVLVQGFVPSAREILLLRHGQGSWLREQVEGVRGRISAAMRRELPTPAREFLLALVTGEAGGLPHPLREAFSFLGLSHLLAISGLNFGLLAVMVYGSVRWILLRSTMATLRFPVEKAAWIVAVPVLAGYGGIAGMGPSVQRALVMALALALVLILDRVRWMYHALALAALVILVFQPSAIYDLSFQLSFLAVLGILYGVPRWAGLLRSGDPLVRLEPVPRSRRWLHAAILLALTSAAAFFATFPVAALHFHLLPVLSLPANLITVPLVNFLVLPLALLGSGLFLMAEPLGTWILWIPAWIADGLIRGVEWGAAFSGGGCTCLPPDQERCFFSMGLASVFSICAKPGGFDGGPEPWRESSCCSGREKRCGDTGREGSVSTFSAWETEMRSWWRLPEAGACLSTGAEARTREPMRASWMWPPTCGTGDSGVWTGWCCLTLTPITPAG
jgi:competence protein ComEC